MVAVPGTQYDPSSMEGSAIGRVDAPLHHRPLGQRSAQRPREGRHGRGRIQRAPPRLDRRQHVRCDTTPVLCALESSLCTGPRIERQRSWWTRRRHESRQPVKFQSLRRSGEATDGSARPDTRPCKLGGTRPAAQWCLSCVHAQTRFSCKKLRINLADRPACGRKRRSRPQQFAQRNCVSSGLLSLHHPKRVAALSTAMAFPQTGRRFLALHKKLRHALLAEGV